MDFLDRVEGLPTNEKDVPLEDIVIEDTIVTVNPYRDTIADILMKEWKEKHRQLQTGQKDLAKGDIKWTTLSGLKKTQEVKNNTVDTIGKYIQIGKNTQKK